MSEVISQSAGRALQVFECLCADGFNGKTALEIADQTGISMTTAWRMLKTLEASGWVAGIEVSTARGGKEVRWQVSTKIAAIAHAYEQHALARIQGIKSEFQQVTGRELNV